MKTIKYMNKKYLIPILLFIMLLLFDNSIIKANWMSELEDLAKEYDIDLNVYTSEADFILNGDAESVDAYYDSWTGITYDHDEDGNIVGTIDVVTVVPPVTTTVPVETIVWEPEIPEPCEDACECWGDCEPIPATTTTTTTTQPPTLINWNQKTQALLFDDYCMALNDLWNHSNLDNGDYLENDAIVIDDGSIMVLPNGANLAHSSNIQTSNFVIKPYNGRYVIDYYGTSFYISAYIHTHSDPDPNYTQEPTDPDDWNVLSQIGGGTGDVYGIILGVEYVYRFQYNSDGTKNIIKQLKSDWFNKNCN